MAASALAAFLVSCTATPVIARALSRWNIVDVPNGRSSHHQPTPRGGGIAVAIAVLLGVAISPELRGSPRTSLLVTALALGVIGLVEDVVGIPALHRLALLFVGATLCAPGLLHDLRGSPLWRISFAAAVVVWIVGYANAFNFMDGINGIAAAQVVVAGLAWFAVAEAHDVKWLAALGLILASAALGFLPSNLPVARVFLGDVGSYFLGAALAVAAVSGLRAGIPPEAILAPLAVFMVDTATTLARRIARRERWYEPHREHAYQRLTTCLGESHLVVTAFVTLVMVSCSILGALSLLDSVPVRIAADVALAALLALYLVSPGLVSRARTDKLAVA